MMKAVLLAGLLAAGVLQAQTRSAPVLLPLDEHGFDALRAKSKGKVLVLNFWATWCKPCIEEFPGLVKLQETYGRERLDVVFVSVDDDAKAKQKVTAFLRRMNVTSASYIKETGDDEKFINAMHPSWSGAVPATFIYDPEGTLAAMKVEELSMHELERIVRPLLPE